MPQVKSLAKVKVEILTPKLVMLLAQYSYRLKKHNGSIIKLSSKNVLKEIEDTRNQIDDEVLNGLYEAIVLELGTYSNYRIKTMMNVPFNFRGRD